MITCQCVCTHSSSTNHTKHMSKSNFMFHFTAYMEKLFKSSSRDHGTLGHFCSLLRCLPAAKKPKDEVNACVDILLTILKGHYIAAACSILGISAPDETPKNVPTLTTRQSKMKFIAGLHNRW